MIRRLPLLLTLAFAAWILGNLRIPADKPEAFAMNEFGRLPGLSNGRIQPLDSIARNSLLQIREKQAVNTEPWKSWYQKPKMISAIQWLAEMTMNPAVADTRPIFRIDHPDLKGLLGLPLEADEAAKTDGKHFSWEQITVKMKDLQDQARRSAAKEKELRNPFEQAVLRLWGGVALYMKLQNTIQPQNAQDWAKEIETYQAVIEPGRTAALAQRDNKEYDKNALDALARDFQRFGAMSQLEPPLIIPPQDHGDHEHHWTRMGDTLMEMARGEAMPFAVPALARITSAFKSGDVQGFNTAVRDYRAGLVAAGLTTELGKSKSEQLFNFFEPFYRGMILCVLSALLVIGFWAVPARGEWARKSAVWLTVLTFGLLTTGLLFRMILEGRPPVTNLYSSAIFIGWGAVVLGLVLEAFWRNGIGVIVSCICGFLCLIIAHHLSLSGDTMEMMRAVLDTNFWLATHVVIVTLGYASTYVAGFLAIIYVMRGVFTTGLDEATAKSLTKMVYGITCFATLFSFVGTVLGGIWADQSWGRFWGWDAKENGALIIVLWNALILHARWGGMVAQRGLMNCALVGNIVTSWSWFGVNMLGIGLHSYGFMDKAFNWLVLFAGPCMILIALGAIKLSAWRSFSPSADESRGERVFVTTAALILLAVHVVFVTLGMTTPAVITFVAEMLLALGVWIWNSLSSAGSLGAREPEKAAPQPA